MVTTDFVTLLTPISDPHPERRLSAARRFAVALGAVDALPFWCVAASGVPQTPAPFPAVPVDPRWKEFLGTLTDGEWRTATLVSPFDGKPAHVGGIKCADGSGLLLIGGTPNVEQARQVCSLLPLFIAVFKAECRGRAGETGRALAEQELVKQRRLYEAILTNTPDFAYVFDLQHRFIYANKNLLKMWGKTWDEAIGKTCIELGYEPWHAEMHGREIDQVVATRKPLQSEVPFTGTYGRRIYDYIFVPVFGANGEVEAVAGTTRDVTDRKQFEEALIAADRRKDEFLAVLSHELRTPLTAMLGWTRLISAGTLSPDKVAYAISVIERNVERQSQLIEDLLDVSRVITGKLILSIAPVDLRNVIGAAIDSIRIPADEKKITIEIAIDGRAPIVSGDFGRLQQVFWNLLSNAVKFTPVGGRVRIAISQTAATAVVVVADNGRGIRADFLPLVFERFRQADSSTTRTHSGLGLGLAIARHLVELHGGSVLAESAGENKGAAFRVELPLQPNANTAERSSPDVLDGVKSFAAKPLSGVRVLVLEDDDDSRDLVIAVLEAAGASVMGVATAEMAFAEMDNRIPDVLISDIGMPETDGYQFMRQCRSRPSNRGGSVPALALTAYARDDDRQSVLNAGYQMHAPKPIEPGDLVNRVLKLSLITGLPQ